MLIYTLMHPMNALALGALINFACSTILAIVVLRRCPRRDVGLTYGAMNVAVALHAGFYFLWQQSADAKSAGLFLTLLTLAGIWINQGFSWFVFTYIGMTATRRRYLQGVLVGNSAFSVLLFRGGLFSGVEPRFGLGYWGIVTGWFSLYLIFWHLELLIGFGALYWDRRHAGPERRTQLTWLLFAFAVGYFGGITNWPMWYGLHFPPYGNVLVGVYCAITAYAIVRHRVIDVRRIARKTLTYSIVTSVLSLIYLSIVILSASALQRIAQAPQLWATLVGAAVTAFIVQPLQSRVQGWVDRRFGNGRHNYERLLARFSDSIPENSEEQHVLDALERIMREVLQPATIQIR